MWGCAAPAAVVQGARTELALLTPAARSRLRATVRFISSSKQRWALAWVVLALLTALTTLAHAHALGFGSGEFRFQRGRFHLELALDASDDAAEDERRATLVKELEKAVTVTFDAQQQQADFRILSVGEGSSAVDVVEYSGTVPVDAQQLQIRFDENVGDVALDVRSPAGRSLFRRLVLAGDATPLLSLNPPAEADAGVRPTESAATTSTAAPAPAPSARHSPKSRAAATRPDVPAVAIWRMVRVGFEHIIPDGLDHMLFVIGLLLTSTSVRRLVIELSLFTLAHSLTLALSAMGTVLGGTALVEPLIALSIAALGAEYFLRLPTAIRSWLVFGFGLLHGLGFASSLAQTGFLDGELWRAVLGFNVGVELGQLSVALAVWLLVRRWRSRQWFQTRVLELVASGLVFVGTFWSLWRFLDLF